MKCENNYINIIFITVVAIGIIFYLTTITEIEKIYPNQNNYHLNSSGYNVTISSDSNIPDWLLEDIKSNIMESIMTKEVGKSFSNNNNISQIQIDITTDEDEGTNKDNISKAKIILTSHKYIENDESNYDDIIGQVKNIGSDIAEYVQTIFTFYNSNDDIVGTDSTFIDVDKLNPGQKAPFSLMLDKTKIQDAAKYEISLSWVNTADGTEEYLENVDVTKENQPVSDTKEN
jgi:hypothetical protein